MLHQRPTSLALSLFMAGCVLDPARPSDVDHGRADDSAPDSRPAAEHVCAEPCDLIAIVTASESYVGFTARLDVSVAGTFQAVNRETGHPLTQAELDAATPVWTQHSFGDTPVADHPLGVAFRAVPAGRYRVEIEKLEHTREVMSLEVFSLPSGTLAGCWSGNYCDNFCAPASAFCGTTHECRGGHCVELACLAGDDLVDVAVTTAAIRRDACHSAIELPPGAHGNRAGTVLMGVASPLRCFSVRFSDTDANEVLGAHFDTSEPFQYTLDVFRDESDCATGTRLPTQRRFGGGTRINFRGRHEYIAESATDDSGTYLLCIERTQGVNCDHEVGRLSFAVTQRGRGDESLPTL